MQKHIKKYKYKRKKHTIHKESMNKTVIGSWLVVATIYQKKILQYYIIQCQFDLRHNLLDV